jgi:hypothetical protein
MKTTMMARVRAYLAQRRALGFRLQSEGNLLLDFARYTDRSGHRGSLTKKLAITWASLPSRVDRLYWARRLEVLRTFAEHLAITQPKTKIPPRYVFGPAHRGPRPFIYSARQTAQILEAAGQLLVFDVAEILVNSERKRKRIIPVVYRADAKRCHHRSPHFAICHTPWGIHFREDP